MSNSKPRRYTLKALATILEAAGYKAIVEPTVYNTDRKIGRLRKPGKGRKGLEIKVYDKKGELVLEHNNAETYRHTGEVISWMRRQGITVPDAPL